MISPAALEAASELLRCPLCAQELQPDGTAALRCPKRHTFDAARAGYISLLGGARARSGDDADMARARERFLATGAYEPLRRAIIEAVGTPARPDAVILDIGAGTGHYLAGVLDALPQARGIALDTSVRSLQAAAHSHSRTIAATWDAFLPFPLADASVDVVLDVFSPRNPAEFARVLRPDGRLVIARPTPAHLAELRSEVADMVAVDPAKEKRLAQALSGLFTEIETRAVTQTVRLENAQVRDLIGMTPSARHVDLSTLALGEGGSLDVTLSVLVTAYRPVG